MRHESLLRLITEGRLRNEPVSRARTRSASLLKHEASQAAIDFRALSSGLDQLPRETQRTLLWNRVKAYAIHQKPIAYILGHVPFLGLRIRCRAPVLIPRWETEEWLATFIRLGMHFRRIVDLGCGTGAIGIALKRAFPTADVTCVDIDPRAVQLTRENAALSMASVEVIQADMLAMDLSPFDLVASNPPYIADARRTAPSVRRWESPRALYGTHFVPGILSRLGPHQSALIEIDDSYRRCVDSSAIWRDSAGHSRCIAILRS